ncbi:hypothetical protein ACI8AF_06450 [Blastococcus sp. SYSU D00669]
MSAPELTCEAWDASFCSLPHRPGLRDGRDDATAHWVAADSTHVAARLRLPAVDAGAAGSRGDGAWEDLVRDATTRHAATVERYRVEEIEVGAAPSPPSTPFLYLVRMDVEPGHDEEFNRWYTEDHVGGLSRVPGVLCARRFRATNAAADVREYLAVYHLQCPSVRQTARWQRASHTDWSIRIRAHHRRKRATMFVPTGALQDHVGRRPAP